MNNKEKETTLTSILRTGTVLVWWEYSKIKKLISKIFRTKLTANRAIILDSDCSLDSIFEKYPTVDMIAVYSPKMLYSKSEKALLIQLLKAYEHTPETMFKEGINIINKIRPETVPCDSDCNMSAIWINKYYKNICNGVKH
jgi:hypothetical protein